MYIYGGMTDLQERSDCWRWDVNTASWFMLKNKPGPGPLHGHAACRLPSCMLIFGGESGGLATNELWRFHFGNEREITDRQIHTHTHSLNIVQTFRSLLQVRKLGRNYLYQDPNPNPEQRA